MHIHHLYSAIESIQATIAAHLPYWKYLIPPPQPIVVFKDTVTTTASTTLDDDDQEVELLLNMSHMSIDGAVLCAYNEMNVYAGMQTFACRHLFVLTKLLSALVHTILRTFVLILTLDVLFVVHEAKVSAQSSETMEAPPASSLAIT